MSMCQINHSVVNLTHLCHFDTLDFFWVLRDNSSTERERGIVSTLSDRLAKLLKTSELPAQTIEVEPNDSPSSTSSLPSIIQPSTCDSPVVSVENSLNNELSDNPTVLSFSEKVFSPLRYPERLIVIDDELQLRKYISEEINLLDDNQLRQKIAIYQKLGVLVRVCESELHKIGIKRNKKFLDDNEEKSFTKLTASKDDIKERTVRISAREKWVKRMTGLGLSKEKAESLWLEKEKGKD